MIFLFNWVIFKLIFRGVSFGPPSSQYWKRNLQEFFHFVMSNQWLSFTLRIQIPGKTRRFIKKKEAPKNKYDQPTNQPNFVWFLKAFSHVVFMDFPFGCLHHHGFHQGTPCLQFLSRGVCWVESGTHGVQVADHSGKVVFSPTDSGLNWGFFDVHPLKNDENHPCSIGNTNLHVMVDFSSQSCLFFGDGYYKCQIQQLQTFAHQSSNPLQFVKNHEALVCFWIGTYWYHILANPSSEWNTTTTSIHMELFCPGFIEVFSTASDFLSPGTKCPVFFSTGNWWFLGGLPLVNLGICWMSWKRCGPFLKDARGFAVSSWNFTT